MKIIDKIIDNPVLGIGMLLCLGLAVLGFSFMTSAEGQNQASVLVTSDENSHSHDSHVHVMPMFTDDSDDSPFLDPAVPAPETRARQTARVQADFALQPQESRQSTAQSQRIQRTPSAVPEVSDNNSFAITSTELQDNRRAASQPQQQQRRAAVFQTGNEQLAPPNRVEKRDELLFRIVKIRLERGEYEKLTQVVLQMQSPEKAIEAMLDFAEESDDENISQLLDAATAVTVQWGQPRSPVSGMMGMPGGGMGTSGGMAGPGTPPTQPMPGAMGGMGGAMPGGR